VTTFTVETPERMAEFGTALGQRLRAGDLVLLNGELGAGKTTLTRAIGESLGIRGTVTSPTFVLARTHPRTESESTESAGSSADGMRADSAPLVHVDAYRLSSAVELDDLDIDFAESIVVVEWGAGLLDGVTDSWLTIDIVRPTGGGAVTADGHDTYGEVGPRDGGSAGDSLDFSEEAVEPRIVTVMGHGNRWSDLEWVDAFSN